VPLAPLHPHRCLGYRPIAPDGSAGPYVFESYTQVGAQVRALGRACEGALGLQPGARVGVYGSNSPYWIKAMVVSGEAQCSAVL
jgi:long-chain acyl-CoA synthetase